MKEIMLLLLLASVAFLERPAFAGSEPLDEITIYQAELVCPAAQQIGCGSAAKPVLLKLQSDSRVKEAWLNRSGTQIAVIWRERRDSKANQLVAEIVPEQHLRELQGKERARALKSFKARKNWYQGTAVDRLSEEEAGIVAARLVHRIKRLISIKPVTARSLEQQFRDFLTKKLTGAVSAGPAETHERLYQICREHLSENQLLRLKQAFEQGAFDRLRDE